MKGVPEQTGEGPGATAGFVCFLALAGTTLGPIPGSSGSQHVARQRGRAVTWTRLPLGEGTG